MRLSKISALVAAVTLTFSAGAGAQSAGQAPNTSGMDHSRMQGTDHSQMPGMDHSNMPGMQRSQRGQTGQNSDARTGAPTSQQPGTQPRRGN